METIYKYKLETSFDIQLVEMPFGAIILSSQNQNGEIFIWAHVESFNSHEYRRFHVLGTGYPMPENRKSYIGTVQIEKLVYHIYEIF